MGTIPSLLMLSATASAAPPGAVLRSVWSDESDQSGAEYGTSVASAGDVNGDGASDALVGAPYFGSGQMDEGRAYLYVGGPAGLGASPLWTAESDIEQGYFGESVASAGDVDGDGLDDVVVGAAAARSAFLFRGSPAGLEPNPAWTGEPKLEAGDPFGSVYGACVASVGDVNGDGYAEVAVADHFLGKVYVYLGSAAGLATTADWIEQPLPESFFGASLASAGDVNADGFDDLVVGDHKSDTAYAYLGAPSGLDQSAAWSVVSDQTDVYFGYSVASAGDVNGDGFDDVTVGALIYANDLEGDGRAFLYLGSATGLDTSASWSMGPGEPEALYAGSVASAGDVNADGYDDVLVGCYTCALGVGRADLFLGSSSGLAIVPAWVGYGGDGDSLYGISVATAGDVNNDGLDDILIGAPHETHGEDKEGRAYHYVGTCADTGDADLDGVEDACDICPSFDDALDGDRDGVPDGCDPCPVDFDPDQADIDADGIGDACDLCLPGEVDADGDGSCVDEDCDDGRSSVHPGAPEICDGHDSNCDGIQLDDDRDADSDGFPPCAGDCDDLDPASWPGAPEQCDRLDNGCDGDLPLGETDADRDGLTPCEGDCDDAEPAAGRFRPEVCGDKIDNDCDGAVDEACGLASGCGCGMALSPPRLPWTAISLASLGALTATRRRLRARP